MKLFRKLRKLAVAAGTVVAIGTAPSAMALTDLVLLVDGSGSIGTTNFNIFKAGIAGAVGTINTNSTVSLQVYQFSSSAAGIDTVFARDVIDSASDLQAAVNAINGMVYQSGGATNYEIAFDAAAAGIAGLNQNDFQFINMLTDGAPNQGSATTGRANLIAAGADLISFEGVGLGTSATNILLSLAYPAPGVVAPPFPDPISSAGFVVSVADFAGVQAALEQKFQAGGVAVPEPASIALMGLGLLGLGVLRRKQKA